MAVGGAQAVPIVAPAATAQGYETRPSGERARGPFPDVSGHVEDAKGRGAVGILPHWSDAGVTVGGVLGTAGDGAEVGASPPALLGRCIAPGIAPAVGAAGGELPLFLSGKAQSVPGANAWASRAETWTTG